MYLETKTTTHISDFFDKRMSESGDQISNHILYMLDFFHIIFTLKYFYRF